MQGALGDIPQLCQEHKVFCIVDSLVLPILLAEILEFEAGGLKIKVSTTTKN
jgi:hypothetical protein